MDRLASTDGNQSCGRFGGKDDGFVLVAVLAALAVLAMVAVLLTKTVSIDTKITAYVAEQAKDEALANGLTRLAIQHLAVNAPAANKSGPFRLDGIPLFCRISGAVASIALYDADGLVNVNLASPALLEMLLGGVGSAPGTATDMAQAIVDFRSAGEASQGGGSKSAAYQLAGLPHGPKNGRMLAVGELEQVLGMTPALMAALRPLVTVHSRFGIINPKVASLPVLRALAGDALPASALPDPQALDTLRSKLTLPASMTSIARTRSSPTTNSNTYVVRVTIYQGRKAKFLRQATVDATKGTNLLAGLIEWTAIDADLYGVTMPDVSEPPACIGGLLWLTP